MIFALKFIQMSLVRHRFYFFFSTLNFPRVGDKFPVQKHIFNIFGQIPFVFSLSGKMDLQIPCFPYVVATLLQYCIGTRLTKMTYATTHAM